MGRGGLTCFRQAPVDLELFPQDADLLKDAVIGPKSQSGRRPKDSLTTACA